MKTKKEYIELLRSYFLNNARGYGFVRLSCPK